MDIFLNTMGCTLLIKSLVQSSWTRVHSAALSFTLSTSYIWLLFSALRKVWIKTSVYTEICAYLHFVKGVLISYIILFYSEKNKKQKKTNTLQPEKCSFVRTGSLHNVLYSSNSRE